MKKLKLIIVLLICCVLFGCGRDIPAPNNTPTLKNENQDNTSQAPNSHPISTSNREDILGIWYCSNDWRLYIIASNGQFPNIASCLLYNNSVTYNLGLDDSNRISENEFQLCMDDGSLLDATITFTTQGIELSDISDLNFSKTHFDRPDLYSNLCSPMGTTQYDENNFLYVLDQYDTDEMTFMVLIDEVNHSNWIAYSTPPLAESYEHNYLFIEKTTYYTQSIFKGLPVCTLDNPIVFTESQYNSYMAGGQQYFEDSYNDTSANIDSYVETPTNTTPVCDFPLEYTDSFYFPEYDVWVVTYMDKGDAPFEIIDIDILTMDDSHLQLKTQIKNNGEKPYSIYAHATYHDKYGYKDSGNLMRSAYIPSDQVYPTELITPTYFTEHGMRRGIPAGRTGYLFFYGESFYEDLTDIANLSELEIDTRYIYIKLESYNRTDL